MGVALERLEPLGRVARAVLELQHLEAALRLIFLERGFQRKILVHAETRRRGGGGACLDISACLRLCARCLAWSVGFGARRDARYDVRQFDRVFERELGAAANGEMRRVRGITEQDDVAAPPTLALDAAEVEPGGRADEVRRVRLELVAAEISGEELFANSDAFFLTHPVKAEAQPGVFRTLDDESRAVRREAVGVRPDPAVLGFLEREGEGVEDLARAEPDELVGADVDVDTESLRLGVAEARVDPVRRDHEVVAAPPGIGGIAFGVEVQHDTELARSGLQDFEESLAADANEAVAAGGDRLAVHVDVDVVPVRELLGDGLRGSRVVARDVLDREIGKDDSPPEGHAWRIALELLDLVRRIAQLHRDVEIEPRRPAADTGDSHAATSRNRTKRTLRRLWNRSLE